MIRVAIIGITGYAGVEAARLILNHPGFQLTFAGGKTFAGKKLSDVYTHFRGITDIICEETDIDKIAEVADAAIVALPHGASMELTYALANKGLKVVDLSADFRYDCLETYEKVYNIKHACPELNENAVYGIPELFREQIKKASVIANPGCYPTCSILGFAPLLQKQLVGSKSIILDAVSGVSGAGRKSDLSYSFCECTENFLAYKVASHRHTSEIEEKFSLLNGQSVKLTFTPHLAPMKRGMMVTGYADLTQEVSATELVQLYKEFYKNEYFVRVMDEGVFPETKSVAGSNFADIGVTVDRDVNRVIVVSVIDNLGKGASGQGVQNLNLMFGIDEKTGLNASGLYL
ncbi:MAG TPA: N-acetyl-gamma-glutamyl-phosphate reductase [Clostridiales bacterium]|nr:N-acetyl-gamma-glutamyl-phosphate reductase [Clostridiales bacterium]